MYFEIMAMTTAVAFLFLFVGIGMLVTKRAAVVPLVLSGLLLLFCGILMITEGIAIPHGLSAVDTQVGNCTVIGNNTLCNINYTSAETTNYVNITGDWAHPTSALSIVTLAYVLGGTFLTLWGAMNAFEKPMPEGQEGE